MIYRVALNNNDKDVPAWRVEDDKGNRIGNYEKVIVTSKLSWTEAEPLKMGGFKGWLMVDGHLSESSLVGGERHAVIT